MKMKLFFSVISSFLMTQACFTQTQLPKQMPEKISISFNIGGGMSRSYTKVRIEDGRLEHEELKGESGDPQTWTKDVPAEDLKGLYRVFYDNKFDAIKNDTRKEIVYDAGSETISITLPGQNFKSYNVTYGKNSPLSGGNLRRYEAVRKALIELIEKVRAGNFTNPEIAFSTDAEAEKFLQGKWRATGESGDRVWFIDWTFNNGTFKQVGYPPILQEGKYRLVNTRANRLTVELYDQKGTFGTETKVIEIILDPATKKLSIFGTAGFWRTES